jgi:hypothetical protein
VGLKGFAKRPSDPPPTGKQIIVIDLMQVINPDLLGEIDFGSAEVHGPIDFQSLWCNDDVRPVPQLAETVTSKRDKKLV